jgi:hypothetical protein
MSYAIINGKCVSSDSGWYKGRPLDPDSEEFKELVKDGVHVIYDKEDNVLMLVPDSDVMHEIMIHDIELKVNKRIWRENR